MLSIVLSYGFLKSLNASKYFKMAALFEYLLLRPSGLGYLLSATTQTLGKDHAS